MGKKKQAPARASAHVFLEKATYNAGETIKGYVECHVHREIKPILSLQIVLKGEVEAYSRVVNSKSVKAKEIFDHAAILFEEKTLETFPGKWDVVGKFKFSFEFELPLNVASSCKAEAHTSNDFAMAEVSYSFGVRIQTKKKAESIGDCGFNVVGEVPHIEPELETVSKTLMVKEAALRNIGELKVMVHHVGGYAVSKESWWAYYEVFNDSKAAISNIEVKLVEKAEIIVQGHKRKQERVLSRIKHDGVEAGESIGYGTAREQETFEVLTEQACADIKVRKTVNIEHFIEINFIMKNKISNTPTVRVPVIIYQPKA